MVQLSNRTRARLLELFQPSDVELADRLLVEECGDNLPLMTGAIAEQLERIRFAAIRVSGGRLDDLRNAVALAQLDWRDLLVAADFADDPEAHLQWQPRRFDAGISARWIAGENLPGVAFSLNQAVKVEVGSSSHKFGSVIQLRGLEPEPKYLVELDSAESIELFQRLLRMAD
jgi:hypothetical protein